MRLLVLLLLPALLIAADDANVPTLVRQLGADALKDREQASEHLLKLGAPALPELRKALQSSDPEIRRRARRLLVTLERSLFGQVRLFSAEAGSVNTVAFLPDGKRAISGDNRAVRLWDVETGKQLACAEHHRDRVMCLAVHPDGKRLASGSEDRSIRLWDGRDLRPGLVLTGHRGDVRSLAFTADGKTLLSGGLDGLLQAWDVETGKPLHKLHFSSLRCFSLVPFAEGSEVLAALGDKNEGVFWNLREHRSTANLSGHQKPLLAVALSGDGRRALTASQDSTLRLWDIKNRKPILTLSGHTSEVCCVAISPDGKAAVSGGRDKTLCVWDLTTGELQRQLRGHEQPIWSVAFSPDGKHALSGSRDGTIRLWKILP